MLSSTQLLNLKSPQAPPGYATGSFDSDLAFLEWNSFKLINIKISINLPVLNNCTELTQFLGYVRLQRVGKACKYFNHIKNKYDFFSFAN